MPRGPNEKALEAQKLYKQGMKPVDIAKKFNVSSATVRTWKNRYNWDNKESETLQKKRNVRKENKGSKKEVFDDGTRETMQNESLTHEQRLFCIYYSKTFNATQSYLKAYGCKYDVANAEGYKLLVNPCIKAEIQRLQEIKRQQIVANVDDMVEMHMRIAFADLGDYLAFWSEEKQIRTKEGIPITDDNGDPVTFISNNVALNDSNELDTQIIQEVKEGRDGVSIKLADKQKSLDWLDKHFLMNPMDRHKVDFDNAKLEMERRKAEPDDAKEGTKYTGIPATMIAPAFIKVVYDIQEQMHQEYVFPGGRGSTKSSFISLQIIDLIEKNEDINAAVFRQVKDTMRDSVYAQIIWAIQALGLEDEYKCSTNPLQITKKSTGQKIFFRGNDDPMKSKGITVEHGYIGILWFEELDQFKGPEAVRTVTQSVIRGGEKTYIFKSFNPPKSAQNWANKYIKIPKQNMLVTFSTYLDVPKTWLGQPFVDEAEFLKETNPTAYDNEYMGIANGTGGNVFDNVVVREITDEEIKHFDNIMNGVDWGWYPDLYAFTRTQYDPAQSRLYIWQEYTCNKRSNRQTADTIISMGITSYDLLTCDSAENKSVGDYKSYGLLARPAEKGPGSREYSYKWLQSLKEIVIDNVRCPVAADEFLNYEYERDKDGNVISGYPDGDDHVIDSVRYATERIWKRRGQ